MTCFRDPPCVIDAGLPFRDVGNNNFSCFRNFSDSIGVYVFQNRGTGNVLYVGKSNSLSHRLGKRIRQHYTPRNKGGNFRINWCKENCDESRCGNRKQCKDSNEPSFMDFKCRVRESRLIVFSFVRDGNEPAISESIKNQISALESALIRELRPKYDDGELKARRISRECVTRAIARIPNFRG